MILFYIGRYLLLLYNNNTVYLNLTPKISHSPITFNNIGPLTNTVCNNYNLLEKVIIFNILEK